MWNIPDVANWQVLKPDSDFDVNRFCESSIGGPSPSCHGDQDFAYYDIKENGVNLTIFLFNEKRYIVREINGEYYISCFWGLETSSITIPQEEEQKSLDAINTIKKDIDEYASVVKEVKDRYDIIQKYRDKSPWLNMVCYLPMLGGGIIGTFFGGAGLLPGILGGYIGCLKAFGLDVEKLLVLPGMLIDLNSKAEALKEKIESADPKDEKHFDLPACVKPGEY